MTNIFKNLDFECLIFYNLREVSIPLSNQIQMNIATDTIKVNKIIKKFQDQKVENLVSILHSYRDQVSFSI